MTIELPDWVDEFVDWDRALSSDEERMAVGIRLARENVERGTGGPFGAAVVERASGRLVSVGVNIVVAAQSSVLHAEVVALMFAHRALASYTLAPGHELVASCDPCAMCLGAALWSGVTRIVTGAARDDAREVGFDEGPVFRESWRYAEQRGIEVVRGIRREEASAVLRLYRDRGGEIY
jgi:tRNA(Arg) A34 adenosine deaminase TadA